MAGFIDHEKAFISLLIRPHDIITAIRYSKILSAAALLHWKTVSVSAKSEKLNIFE